MNFRIFLFLAIAIFLAGCSSTTQLYWKTIKYALETPDYTKTFTDTLNSQIYLAEVEHGDRPIVTVALAFIEEGQQKWVSSDRIVLATKNDQFVTTSGLTNDLEYLSSVADWPLVVKSNAPASYLTVRDIENVAYQAPAKVTMEVVGETRISKWGHQVTGIKVVQTIAQDLNSPYWELGTTWDNIYVLDPKSYQVLYQEVKFSSHTELLKVTYTSRIAQILAAQGVTE